MIISNKIYFFLTFCLLNKTHFLQKEISKKKAKDSQSSGKLKINNNINNLRSLNKKNSSNTSISVIYKEHLILSESKPLISNSILFFIFFISLYSLINHQNDKKLLDKFTRKSSKILSNKMFLYLLFIAILFILYTFETLDFAKLNWQNLIKSLLIFGIFWMFICKILIIYCNHFINKLRKLEENTKKLNNLKAKYNTLLISSKNKECDNLLESFEYNILKSYFISPTYPIFKQSNLRKDFNLSSYLELCLLKIFGHFFDITWMSWIYIVISILLWNVISDTIHGKIKLWLLLVLPMILILINMLIKCYQQRIYRKVVSQIDQNNLIEFINNLPYQMVTTKKKMIDLPLYIEEILESDIKSCGFKIGLNNFLHNSVPNIYENLLIFGSSGFQLLINSIQLLTFLFVLWIVLIIFIEIQTLINTDEDLFIILFVIFFVVYIIYLPYLISSNINMFTLLSSIEMNRDEKLIKKVIVNQLKNSQDISESIYSSFKRLYYDMRVNEKNTDVIREIFPLDYKEIGISKSCFKDLLEMNFRRFNNIEKYILINGTQHLIRTKIEEYPMNLDNLKSFLQTTCGINLSNEELEHMLHFLEKDLINESYSITSKEIYELLIANTFFSNYLPQTIIFYVYDRYEKELERMESSQIGLTNEGSHNTKSILYINLSKIRKFFEFYKNYFTDNEINFIENECSMLEQEFSLDEFVYSILSLRKFKCY